VNPTRPGGRESQWSPPPLSSAGTARPRWFPVAPVMSRTGFHEGGLSCSGHTNAVTTVAFSRDGHRIFSGSIDDTLRVWDADTGQPLGRPLTGHTATVISISLSPDGNSMVSGSFDETLRLWPTPAQEEWPNLLCNKLTENMSHNQWRDWVSPDVAYIELCPGLPVAPDS
jgi:WD40 repeat protein